jgi:hypothetical protein
MTYLPTASVWKPGGAEETPEIKHIGPCQSIPTIFLRGSNQSPTEKSVHLCYTFLVCAGAEQLHSPHQRQPSPGLSEPAPAEEVRFPSLVVVIARHDVPDTSEKNEESGYHVHTIC